MAVLTCKSSNSSLSAKSLSTRCNENKLKTKDTPMNLIRNFRDWRRYRNTVNELSRLSVRELNDLGLTRADIPAVASRKF